MPIFIIIAYILSTASALVLIKLGTSSGVPISIIENSIKLNLNIYTVLGIILYGTSFLLYMYLLSKFDLGFIIPLTLAFVYILIFIASFVIFKETFTALKVFGIFLILGGVVLLSLNK
jgi:drug/metabolite transporter (DMT)-like permease